MATATTSSAVSSATTTATTTVSNLDGWYWERHRRRRLWPLLLLGLAARGLPFLGQLTLNRSRVEDELSAKALANLEANGIDNVAVRFDGRDATLTAGPSLASELEKRLQALQRQPRPSGRASAPS